jgi:hypothetical protein
VCMPRAGARGAGETRRASDDLEDDGEVTGEARV